MTGATAGVGLYAARRLADPSRDPQLEKRVRQACFRVYSSSKLCTIMTARAAARRYPALSVMSFDPGYVPHTGLGRDHGRLIATLTGYIVPLPMASDRTSNIARSGGFLAGLATGAEYAACRGDYWSVHADALRRIEPSVPARDAAACARLWDDSAQLVGLRA